MKEVSNLCNLRCWLVLVASPLLLSVCLNLRDRQYIKEVGKKHLILMHFLDFEEEVKQRD